MERVYERKHTHLGGSMIATVTEYEDGNYDACVHCCSPDGRALVIAFGRVGYQSLAEAQCGADEEIHVLGHECSELCEQWPRSLMH